MDLKQRIQTEAFRLGFSHFGVVKPSPPPSMPAYLNWLEAGHHGEMSYLATDRAIQRRKDPTIILLEVNSIIVLAICYPAPRHYSSITETPLSGRVAAYALGRDYHDILPPRLEDLSAFIQQETGRPVVSRGYTDTGPILERDLATRAGLGWIGKNSCLIDPKAGSFFLLAELFTSVDLAPDAPFETDHCGSCRRCIEACPTQSILPDRTLDARRCISYLTIENKGGIAPELRPKIGSWVFGCDVCQQVCPWNIRFAGQKYDADLQSNFENSHPNLMIELHLTPHEFNRHYKNSPIKRSKRRGYLRNVAVALGNSGSPDAVPALAEALLGEPEPLVRAHSAWALGRLDTQGSRVALQKAKSTETDPSVLAEIQAALTEKAGSPSREP